MDEPEEALDALQQFHTIAHENDIPYWVDSGSLLGLVRDGSLIDNDVDVDLAMWKADDWKILNHINAFESEFKVETKILHGTVYSIKFMHESGCRKFVLDFYWEGDEYAWAPQIRKRQTPSKINTSVILPLIQYWLLRLWSQYHITVHKEHKHLCKQLPNYFEYKTWKIPKSLFNEISYNEEFEVNIPQDSEDYLEYRYGDWQSPVEVWDYWEMDGGLINKDFFDIDQVNLKK